MLSKTHTLLTASVLALTALLASCGRSTAPQAATAADSVMTVLNPGSATDAQLEAKYHGHLVTRTPSFALLTVSADSARLAPLSAKVRVEKNRKVFRINPDPAGRMSGSGSQGVWGSGSQGVWGTGSQGVWGTGSQGVWGTGSQGVWGTGSQGVWGTGSQGVWGTGSQGVWGTGRYEPMPQNSDTWQQISLDAVQSASRAMGSGVTVAVVDTGVDLIHPAFFNRLSDVATWHDFVSGDALPQDDGILGTGLVGHGTEVAGIVAQVAPLAKIMPLRVLDTDGTGDVAAVASAIVWAADHGADVINLSLGASESVEAVSQAVAYANSKGVTVAASVGNSGTEGLDYPAAEFSTQPLNVSVGSVDLHDAKSSFSRYASTLEVLAPGEVVYGPAPQNRFAAWSGTSMSAPIVSGALALGRSVGATGAQAAAALTSSATSVAAVSGNTAYAGKLGSGRVDLDAAIAALGH